MSSGALTLDRITKRYPGGERPAVNAVTLQVRAGELLALVGASGSGKTTTLRLAAGYEHPDSGEVLLAEADGAERAITALPPERRGFGMVFQHYALFPHMTVEENVAFGLEARRVRKAERIERARRALAGVGLERKGTRSVQSLSGGEQQRVALARALVIEPPVLLLDEPLSNLDPTLRQSTRDELRVMLHRLGVTALFVTHDQEDAFAIADRVAMLRHGTLLQVGTPEELYHEPANRHVAEFIGRGTLLPAEWGGSGTARITVGGVAQAVPVFVAERGHAGAASSWLAVLRPEAVRLVPVEHTVAWKGEIVTRRFAGAHHEFTVRLAPDVAIGVAASGAHWREGDHVGVEVKSDGSPVPLVRS
ncbi:MAG TPA: ABC transporter ATP-binding protein [Gemmatimonadaceae bacterium]|nr:ABC transporter ATP-binding protein [Gemmatimonadaceae bacterium]